MARYRPKFNTTPQRGYTILGIANHDWNLLGEVVKSNFERVLNTDTKIEAIKVIRADGRALGIRDLTDEHVSVAIAVASSALHYNPKSVR